VIHGNTGAGGGRRLNITNCELRDINTGGASSTIIVSAYLALIVTNNHIRDLGTPVNWLETQYVNTITTLAHNIVNGAENISLNGTAYGGYTDGTFNGATRITQAEFGDLTIQDGLVVGNHSTLNGGLTVGRARVQFSLDITPVTAANNTTLGTGGIVFVIAGNTPIHCIEHTGWQQGAMIYIEFSGSPTIKNGQSCGASFTPLFLAGSADYAATPGNTLTICLITPGVEFREFGRTV
jgi:hypothetical protein